MLDQKEWRVVYTRYNWEKKVASLMTEKSFENYCPLGQIVKQWADRTKIIEAPLFNSLVFVKVSEKEESTIGKLDGVINFVHWMKKPAIVKVSEIEAIKKYVTHSYTHTVEKINVSQDSDVSITTGPFVQQEGTKLEVQDNSLKIHLPSIGYAITAVAANGKSVNNIISSEEYSLKEKSLALINSISISDLFHESIR